MKPSQSIVRPFQSSLLQSQQRVQFEIEQKSPQFANKSLLLKSQTISKSYHYVKYDLQGNTQIVNQLKTLEEDFSYQKVHVQAQENQLLGQDINWVHDLQKLSSAINTKQKIVMRPLRKLWQRNFRPNFFDRLDQTKSTSFQYHTHQLPQFLYELDHLSSSHSKFLFLTQDYSNNGLYKIILNEDGRHRLVTVDDLVPVYDQSNEHVWEVEEPWKMILLRVWACLNDGYDNILKRHKPFRTLEYFTGNNWRFYNLEREGSKWINHFKEVLNVCYIVLQTKNLQTVHQMGLVPDSACYTIVSIHSAQERGVQIEVKSRFKHKWKGKLNMVSYSKKLMKDDGREFRLEKNFILTKVQFFQLFCSAYITSLSKSSSHISDYVEIKIPKQAKNAVYLKFSIKTEGFMDFSFIQSHKNKILFESAGQKIDAQKYRKQTGSKQAEKTRYLNCKYMVIKILKGSNKPFESKLSKIKSKNEINLTKQSRYEAYEVVYLRGQNKGQAHFLIMQPGEYYFRLKSQTTHKDAVYYLNYCCSQKVDILEEIILGEERQQMMQNCVLSLLPAAQSVKHKLYTMYLGNKFEDMGYGFVVVENTSHMSNSSKNVSFKVDTQKLSKEGYKLKGKKYNQGVKPNVFLEIEPKAYLVLILKKISYDLTQKCIWPPNSIHQIPSKSQQ